MGKGDKKSKKGKIFMGSYGVTRPHKKKKSKSASPKKIEKKAEKAEKVVKAEKVAAPKKAARKVTKKAE